MTINIFYTVIAISVCLALGKLTNNYINGFPAGLFGMVYYGVFLQFRLISAHKVAQTNSWIIKHMGVCFVPPGLGIINHFQLIQRHGLALVVIIFLSTFLLLTLVGVMVQISEAKQ